MAHPQNSPRGLFAKQRIDAGSSGLTFNSTALLLSKGLSLSGRTTGVITHNTTGALVLSGGVRISNAAGGLLTANSTSLLVPGNVKLSGKSTGTIAHNTTGTLVASGGVQVSGQAVKGLITANSTATILPAIKVGALASYVTANSTGIKIGNLYISCNSTGNTTT